MASSLTSDAIREIVEKGASPDTLKPKVQVLNVTANPKAKGRYRLVLSDGVHKTDCITGTQLAAQFAETDGVAEIQKLSIVTLDTYSLAPGPNGAKFVMILGISLVTPASEVGAVIGEPVGLGGSDAAAAAPQSAATATPASGSATPSSTASSAAETAPSTVTSAYQCKKKTASRGAVVRSNPNTKVTPIERLNPYNNGWTIKARITNKGKMVTWSNAKGEGCLFKIQLLDEAGHEIEACMFKEAAEKWYPVLEEQRVYLFSAGRLKVANKQFSAVKNDYELSFDSKSRIEEVEDDAAIGSVQFDFVKIGNLEQVEVGGTCDILGIVKSFDDCQEIVSQKQGGKVMHKRDLTLIDESNTEVRLTLWGEQAQEDDAQWRDHAVLACKQLKVSEWNGRSLGALRSSQLVLQPDLPEAEALHVWWTTGGSSMTSQTLSTGGAGGKGFRPCPFGQRKSLLSIKEESLGHGEKPDFITVKATVSLIRHDKEPWYLAEPESKAKVVEQSDGTFWCEKLNKSVEQPTYRFIMGLAVMDASGSSFVSCFNDEAQALLGLTADELHEKFDSGDNVGYEDAFKLGQFETYHMNLRVRSEMYQDEKRIKTTISGLKKVDFESESKDLLAEIAKYQ